MLTRIENFIRRIIREEIAGIPTPPVQLSALQIRDAVRTELYGFISHLESSLPEHFLSGQLGRAHILKGHHNG
jgi:hypothetical protein